MGPPGHFGIALASKPTAPKVPLWTLLVASEVLDLLSFGFEAVGLEKYAVSETNFERGVKILSPCSLPWSQGLFMSVVWSLLFGGIVYQVTKDRHSSIVSGLVVFSHWILDFVVHLPYVPLLFGDSPQVGLGLWSSGPGLIASAVLEFALLFGGIVIYGIWIKREKKKFSPI